MKGIYLTEEGRQEIEDKIAELEKNKYPKLRIDLDVYKEILSSATILPVEESWTTIDFKYPTYFSQMTAFPNGLIIQPK